MNRSVALKILNLNKKASFEDAKKAYRKLAKKYHPDVVEKNSSMEKDAESKMKDINLALGHQNYSRLRFGIGNDYPRGSQAHYVLSPWDDAEKESLSPRIELAVEIIQSFGIRGVANTMNEFNNR